MTTKSIETRIKELLSTPAALVGSDEGTHQHPRTFRVYEDIRGTRFAKKSFSGDNGVDCTEAEANERTEGRMRNFPVSTKEIRAKAAELLALEKKLRESVAA